MQGYVCDVCGKDSPPQLMRGVPIAGPPYGLPDTWFEIKTERLPGRRSHVCSIECLHNFDPDKVKWKEATLPPPEGPQERRRR